MCLGNDLFNRDAAVVGRCEGKYAETGLLWQFKGLVAYPGQCASAAGNIGGRSIDYLVRRRYMEASVLDFYFYFVSFCLGIGYGSRRDTPLLVEPFDIAGQHRFQFAAFRLGLSHVVLGPSHGIGIVGLFAESNETVEECVYLVESLMIERLPYFTHLFLEVG